MSGRFSIALCALSLAGVVCGPSVAAEPESRKLLAEFMAVCVDSGGGPAEVRAIALARGYLDAEPQPIGGAKLTTLQMQADGILFAVTVLEMPLEAVGENPAQSVVSCNLSRVNVKDRSSSSFTHMRSQTQP